MYPTFIKKTKEQESDQYVPIPKNEELLKAILFELGHTKEGLSKVSIQFHCCAFKGSNSTIFMFGSTVKGKNLLLMEQILFFKSRPLVGRVLSHREADRKSQKLSPCEAMGALVAQWVSLVGRVLLPTEENRKSQKLSPLEAREPW